MPHPNVKNSCIENGQIKKKFPFWINLTNCKNMPLAFNAFKGVDFSSYNKENDIYFVEALSSVYKNFEFKSLNGKTQDNSDITYLSPEEKAFHYFAHGTHWQDGFLKIKDFWLNIDPQNNQPFFHTMAQRKNNVFFLSYIF